MSPREAYQSLIDSGEFEVDPAQAAAVEELERIHVALSQSPKKSGGLFSKIFGGAANVTPEQGLYLWGGVGRGKTWLMDVFYEGLPFEEKRRVHFHRYMRSVHESLRELGDQQNPLRVIAEREAQKIRILCFDEFVVEDIGDAMILSGLLTVLFEKGVTLVATSNTEPDNLYKDGLQRARFKPAIELIKQHTRVMVMADGLDFRLRSLNTDAIYHVPPGDSADASLSESFKTLADQDGSENGNLLILGREIAYRRRAEGVVWFDFDNICGGPRSSADYIEIAKEFHTVVISGIPVMDSLRDDAARRFIEMIDEFYDRNINLIVSAQAGPTGLYTGKRLTKPFERTTSRLIEMQSVDYLSREKRA